jgi:putative glutamine amidotransferase
MVPSVLHKSRSDYLIGITCDEEVESGRFRSPRALSQAVQKAGGIPLLLPSLIPFQKISQLVGALVGVVIAGGAFDIPPSFYGEKKRFRIDAPQRNRSDFEFRLIREAIRQKKPLLGICGGMQAINVVLGGTLYQDIASQVPSASSHEQKLPCDRPIHRVNLVKGSHIQEWLGTTRIRTNSTHHQAVKDLGKGLSVTGSAEDGVIEAIELVGAGLKPAHSLVIGIQWHPEVLNDNASRRLLREFIRYSSRPIRDNSGSPPIRGGR